MYLGFSDLPPFRISQLMKQLLTGLIHVFDVRMWQQAGHNSKPVK